MKSCIKYVLSFLLSIISCIIALLLLSRLSSGTNSEFTFVDYGIILIIAVIIGCTSLIITTIKEYTKK